MSEEKSSLPPGLPVNCVRLHQAFDIGGLTGTSLYRKTRAGAIETDMVYTPAGVFGYRKPTQNKPGIYFVVPLANVIVVYLDEPPQKAV